jgi:hypothetical protein
MNTIDKKPNTFTTIFAIVLTDFGNIILGITAIYFYPECIIFYSQVSAILFVFYESFLILNTKALAIAIGKQVTIWVVFSYLNTGFDFPDPAPYISGIFSMMIFFFFYSAFRLC